MVPLSKSGVRKHRGFESRPLRHTIQALPTPRARGDAWRDPGRGRLVDYGAALEMRFAATRRGFESPPLRHPTLGSATDWWPRRPAPSGRSRLGFSVHCRCRARRGTSGALYLQSAPAGLNSLPRSPRSEAAGTGDVEDRVPRSGESRIVSGPEGSSTQRSSSGAAEQPGPSRLRQWARVAVDRRRVHGTSTHHPPGRPGRS